MHTHHEDVDKNMTFNVGEPINTVFNDFEELGDISTADDNPYTNQQYINLDDKIFNNNEQ